MESNQKNEVYIMTTAQKWGNSVGVRIPQRLAKKYGVVNGSQIRIEDDGEGIKITPIRNEPTLEELLSLCTPENRHEEINFGIAGKELI